LPSSICIFFFAYRSFCVFHLASFHHQISIKLRSDVSSVRSLTAGMGCLLLHVISVTTNIPSIFEPSYKSLYSKFPVIFVLIIHA
jgi:hypothetical protein